MNIAEATAAIHHEKLSPVELTRQHLDRIEKLNPKLNAFVTVTAEQALPDARALETGPWLGRLHGVPIVLGKLNMDEFAYNFTGATNSFGTSRNPWNPAMHRSERHAKPPDCSGLDAV